MYLTAGTHTPAWLNKEAYMQHRGASTHKHSSKRWGAVKTKTGVMAI